MKNANAATLRSMLNRVDGYGMAICALELCYEQMQQCEKMFRDDEEFMAALSRARMVLGNHGRL